MDYYNNYYEELYHAGLFSALRGRIRDGHKWITRTGTPGHYVYTYAKDLAGKARSMFGKPRGMFGTRKTTSASKSTWKESGSSNSGTNDWHDSQRKDAEEGKRDDRFVDRTAKGLAKRDANTGRNVGKMTTSMGDSSPSYVNDSGERASRKYVDYSQYEDGGKKKVTRTDYNTRNTTYRNGITVDGSRAGQSSRTSFNTREYNLPIKKKSVADQIKEWGANTLSSIRKTANDAAGAVSKGYDSAKNWVGRKLASASGKGTSVAAGANASLKRPSAPLLSTRQNAVADKLLDNKTKATIGRWERSHPGEQTWKKDSSIVPQFVADKQRKREQGASIVTSSSLKGGRQSMPSEKRYRVKTTSTGSSYDDGYLKTARKLSGKTYLTDTDQGDWHRNLQAFSKSASQNKNGKASIQKGLMNERPTITSATAVNGHTKDPIGASKTVVSKDDERRKKKSNRR